MPVCIIQHATNQRRFTGAASDFEIAFREASPKCIEIGLLNNMPDAALRSTERQFSNLLKSVADNLVVRLSLYALPEVPRSDSGRRQISDSYSDFDHLLNRRLDGLIITGTEPRAETLRDEPYWASLTRVFDWAERNTHSTVLSCLAAHAAVYHLDGISRERLPNKRFGLFACSPVAAHSLTTHLHSPTRMPHSRWNDLSETSLQDCGYRVLTRSTEAGADIFVKHHRNLMVFFQGHPEYEASTLLLEYRRDVGRFLRGEQGTYPALPNGYFDSGATEALTAFASRAAVDRRADLLSEFPSRLAEANLDAVWQSQATRVYRSWLDYLCREKELRLRQRPSRTPIVAANAIRVRRRAAAG